MKKSEAYQSEKDVDIADLILDQSEFEITKVNEKSLEILAHVLSFLYEEDAKLK